MRNNIVVLFTLLLAMCIYIFNNGVIENYWNISGSNYKNAYAPQHVKEHLAIPNYKPHGTSSQNNNGEDNQHLETFNFHSREMKENYYAPTPSNEFNHIEQFKMKSNDAPVFNQTNYNTRSPQSLPQSNLNQTHIPVREDYQNSKGVGVSKVTPYGFRNGARPQSGAGLLRGEVPIRENFSSGSVPQFGSFNQPLGNIQKRGGRDNANARGDITINHEYQIGQPVNAQNLQDAVRLRSNLTASEARAQQNPSEYYTAKLPRKVADSINNKRVYDLNNDQGRPLPHRNVRQNTVNEQFANLDDTLKQQYANLDDTLKQQYANCKQQYGGNKQQFANCMSGNVVQQYDVSDTLGMKQQYKAPHNMVGVKV